MKKFVNINTTMRNFTLIFVSVLASQFNSNIAQDESICEPFNCEASYTGDAARNFYGGIKTGNAYLGIIDLLMIINTEGLGLWKGGKVVLQVENTHGDIPSAQLTGDIQAFDNIENGHNTYLFLAYYQQQISNLSVTIGINDLNADFHVTENSCNLINSSFGIMSLAPLNLPVPIFQKTALSSVLRYDFSESFALQTGIYDGDPLSLDEDQYNLNHNIGRTEGYLNITEIQISQSISSLNGVIKIGYQYHNWTFSSLSDSTEQRTGNFGLYFLNDQDIINSGGEGLYLGTFFQFGWAPKDYNINPLYFGAGFNLSGFGQKHSNDILTFGVAHTCISDPVSDIAGSETAFELSYILQLHTKIAIQPDFQYILNPLAGGKKDAIVGMIRISLTG
ncbi:MAG: carbohydrate porin [Bacteroidales bacterium]|nr:carbohydrate porin [Bacteroidales bacterium]